MSDFVSRGGAACEVVSLDPHGERTGEARQAPAVNRGRRHGQLRGRLFSPALSCRHHSQGSGTWAPPLGCWPTLVGCTAPVARSPTSLRLQLLIKRATPSEFPAKLRMRIYNYRNLARFSIKTEALGRAGIGDSLAIFPPPITSNLQQRHGGDLAIRHSSARLDVCGARTEGEGVRRSARWFVRRLFSSPSLSGEATAQPAPAASSSPSAKVSSKKYAQTISLADTLE